MVTQLVTHWLTLLAFKKANLVRDLTYNMNTLEHTMHAVHFAFILFYFFFESPLLENDGNALIIDIFMPYNM